MRNAGAVLEVAVLEGAVLEVAVLEGAVLEGDKVPEMVQIRGRETKLDRTR
ncbi:hypothetical protein [Aureimonas sp. Leaf454]|uniref:hypothetical protein n=1 Tax=Aureimonas sp. Leaf454 TaxID=1736381 RepID=UPI000AAA8DDE|nr:hypothetical protein [Aureimonas sp. Leaf454]